MKGKKISAAKLMFGIYFRAYIKSIDSSLTNLLMAYRKDGLLEVRLSLQYPKSVERLEYDPNAETTW